MLFFVYKIVLRAKKIVLRASVLENYGKIDEIKNK